VSRTWQTRGKQNHLKRRQLPSKHEDNKKSERKFAGSATYDCKFDNEWIKKSPFIQHAAGDPYSFLCTICSKKVSCSHQGFGDVARHCKSATHIKFKNQLNNQKKLERPDESLSKKVCIKRHSYV
jgi:hypothetical protein